MINIQAKIHDRFSIEFKVGFNTVNDQLINKFMMNTWIFVPYSLDINPATYSKKMFYRDLRSNTRLITPVYLLKNIVRGKAEPLNLLKKSFVQLAESPNKTTLGDYEYNIKMFAAIFKSSLRNQIFFTMSPPIHTSRKELCEELLANIEEILLEYRELRNIINIPTLPGECSDYYLFGDEFMSNIVHKQLFRIINFLKKEDKETFESVKAKVLELITKEIKHRKTRGYPVIQTESHNRNRDLVYRSGALKKYIESELFLNTDKKRDAVVIEQIYYSVAAGISMIFATAIAFSFQLRFGNFTIPFFVALVVSYMLKDRIKELTRYYFAHKLKEKYFDNKTTITLNDHKIGWSKEGVDFIKESVIPSNILKIRDRTPLLEAQNRYSGEKIILFRKLIELNRKELEANSEYPITGVNEILRFNLSSYMQKMDDPDVPLYVIEKTGDYKEITGDKVYFLNFIIQFKYENHESYKRYRVVFNRNGIEEIEELL